MCAGCASGTQAAYNQGSIDHTQTNNVGSMTDSDSVNESGLPNAQNEHDEGQKATSATPNTAEKDGWGS